MIDRYPMSGSICSGADVERSAVKPGDSDIKISPGGV